ncbi:hypothetical protein SAMN05444354_109205 [Stigmatella aurantiaca]|uniref:Uncharacterized protein n=1 Tax=Stigmatella aurantiaca TaxID=41 RepID=A0A1H7TWP3_STIAU|nr:hypothetical protein [Stigmatella aurantiaca]SEL89302.1 hypothetical protein SAMN05444354_109205 [Stigmatella aurantiaca]
MPRFVRSMDVQQGFNAKQSSRAKVGFITELKIGDVELAGTESAVKEPEQGKTLEKVVGVMSEYAWDTGPTDAMYLSAQISTANKQLLSGAMLSSLTNIEVSFKYVIYEYDPVQKKYFKSNFSDAALKGILEKRGEDLVLDVAEEPSTEVQEPKNFTLSLGIKAQSEQTINLAASAGAPVVKNWGVGKAS